MKDTLIPLSYSNERDIFIKMNGSEYLCRSISKYKEWIMVKYNDYILNYFY